MLNIKQLQQFFYEIHDTNSMVTGGRMNNSEYCPVRCAFCFCKGDPTNVVSYIPFIDDNEFELGMQFISYNTLEINFGDGASRLAAEPFSHPKVYKYLEMLCNKFPNHMISVTTTGVLIRKDKVDFLNSLKNLHLHISINSLQKEAREEIMPYFTNPDKLKYLLTNLERYTIYLLDTGNINILKKDMADIKKYSKLNSFIIHRIEHTKYHNKKAIELSKKSIYNYENSINEISHQDYFSVRCGTPYMKYAIGDKNEIIQFNKYVNKVKNVIEKTKYKRYMLGIAESSYEFWKENLGEMDNVRIFLVKNNFFGGSVTVAGLMTFSDIMNSAIENNIDINVYNNLIIPDIMLNRSMMDLNDVSIIDIRQKYGINPIIL